VAERRTAPSGSRVGEFTERGTKASVPSRPEYVTYISAGRRLRPHEVTDQQTCDEPREAAEDSEHD
jgi:hypothetical protein